MKLAVAVTAEAVTVAVITFVELAVADTSSSSNNICKADSSSNKH